MNIVPDWILVALQTLPFLVAFLALRSLLFKPMIEYLEERDAAISGARDESTRLRERVAQARADWERRLAEARAEGAAHRASIHAEANSRRQELVDQARAAAEAQVGSALAELEAARVASAAQLREGAEQLAHDIAERVLDRPVPQA
jgi:F-type H+-transporting ATPase subunit b